MYQVLARKWRPKNFQELVGQQHVTQALTYALDNDRIHHAYLFTGTRGVGKTTIARIFAKSLNCRTNGVSAMPCGECEHCHEIDLGRFPDLIEVDAASRTGVDDTRELLDNVPYAPVKGRYKVYLIDEVHMFSRSSFNALLKTLEEPPKHVKFILATTDPQKMPATVLSRCLQFHLKNMTTLQIVAHLQAILDHDNISYEQDGLRLLAEAGSGSMRDSLSLLDQAIAYGRGTINSRDVAQLLGAVPAQQLRAIVSALADADAPALRDVLHNLDEFSPDYLELLKRLLYQLQEITIAQLDAERYSGEIDSDLKSLAQRLPVELVQLWYQIATDGWQNLAYQPDIRLAVEMILLRMIALRPVLPTTDPAGLAKIPEARPAEAMTSVDVDAGFEKMQAMLNDEETSSSASNTDTETPSTSQEGNQTITKAISPPWDDESILAENTVNAEQKPSESVKHWAQTSSDTSINAAPNDVQESVSPPWDDESILAENTVSAEQKLSESAESWAQAAAEIQIHIADLPATSVNTELNDVQGSISPPWNDEPIPVENTVSAEQKLSESAENWTQAADEIQRYAVNLPATSDSPAAVNGTTESVSSPPWHNAEIPAETSTENTSESSVQAHDTEPLSSSVTVQTTSVSVPTSHSSKISPQDLSACIDSPTTWAELVIRLNLSDQASVILDHSVVLDWQAPNLTLGMSKGAMTIADKDVCDIIAAAISEHIAAPCVVLTREDEADDTPAALRGQAEIDDRLRAEAEMRNHPIVQMLQQRLGASIVPGSVTSLNPQFNRSE